MVTESRTGRSTQQSVVTTVTGGGKKSSGKKGGRRVPDILAKDRNEVCFFLDADCAILVSVNMAEQKPDRQSVLRRRCQACLKIRFTLTLPSHHVKFPH
jgi:hypothetical protein